MRHSPDMPGPGEHDEAHIVGEPSDRPMPHGDLPIGDTEHDLRQKSLTLDIAPVGQSDPNAESHRLDLLRRTGTDTDAMRPVRASDDLPENRQDQSAHDLQRETRFDPAQDNVGPQSDKS